MKKKTPKYFPKYELVMVDWLDAWYSNHDDDDHKPLPLKVVGQVIRHDAVGIKLAMETGPVGNRQLKFIPTGMIAKVTRLLVPTK